MKILITIFILFTIIPSQIIIDHEDTDLSAIPLNWVDSAKQKLYIGYGHTSHGSQLTSGMNALDFFFTDGRFNWSHNGGENELHLFEGDGYGSGWLDHDCGYSGWDQETRNYLDNFPDCNVIIWSWCGQVNDYYTNETLQSHYLDAMNQLETEYPNVTFVYMTGHSEGTGESGSVHLANQMIRNYCINNNKILFDFYDIECYDPDNNYFGDLDVNDDCSYDGGNWATEWISANPADTLTQLTSECSSCAHSHCLNCIQKGIAVWHLWAYIAGWDGESKIESLNKINYESELDLKISPNPFNPKVNISFYLNNNSNIKINIIDCLGKIVHSFKSKNHLKGKHVISWNPSENNLNSGIYFATLYNDNEKIKSKKLIFIK